MPKYDEFFKLLLRHCPRDFVRLLFPEHPVEDWTISLENVEVQALQRRMDTIVKVCTPQGKRFLIDYEFQGQIPSDFVERLQLYRSMLVLKELCPVKTAILFVERDKSILEFPGEFKREVLGKEEERFRFEKMVVEEWDGRDILEKGLTGLLPLIPLCKMKEGEEREILREGWQKIQKLEGPLKEDFLIVFWTFAGYNERRGKIVLKLIKEEMMRNLEDSITYQELFKDALEKGREEGREKGREEGAEKKARDALLRILKARFGAVSEIISLKVEGMDSIEQLDTLIEKAATCGSLEDFEEGLETG